MTLPPDYLDRRANGLTIQFVEHALPGRLLRQTIEPGSRVTLYHRRAEIQAVVISCLDNGRIQIRVESMDVPSATPAMGTGASLIVDEANVFICELP